MELSSTHPQFHPCSDSSFLEYFGYFGIFCFFCLPFPALLTSYPKKTKDSRRLGARHETQGGDGDPKSTTGQPTREVDTQSIEVSLVAFLFHAFSETPMFQGVSESWTRTSITLGHYQLTQQQWRHCAVAQNTPICRQCTSVNVHLRVYTLYVGIHAIQTCPSNCPGLWRHSRTRSLRTST